MLSIGEEPTKGNPLVKQTHEQLAAIDWQAHGATFLGNVEGRDLMSPDVDVVVTDGFTGNVALKTLEGGVKAMLGALLGAFAASPEAERAAEALRPALEPLYHRFDPDTYGGAMLLGVDGVCIISHGSSSATAIENAIQVAADMVSETIVDHLAGAVARD